MAALKDEEKNAMGRRDAVQAWRESRLICVPTLAYINTGAGKLRVEVSNVSRSGICFALDTCLDVGSPVKLELGSLLIGGEVRYCRPRDGGFFTVGMRIESTQKI